MSRRQPLSTLVVLALAPAFGAWGCSHDDPPQERSARHAASLAGATPDAESTAVVYVRGCTGTLIAPNVVLTARHCAASLDEVPEATACARFQFGNTFRPSLLSVSTLSPQDGSPAPHEVASVVVPPVHPEGAAMAQLCGNDLALLILEASIDPSEATPLVPRIDEDAHRDEGYSAVGFGVTGSGDPGPATRRRLDALAVRCVGDCSGDNTPQENEWRGDGVCSGDSGGPAIDAAGRVIGVVSRGDANPCGSATVHGHVASHAAWLKDSVVEATAAAGLAPPPWSTGWPTDPAYSHPVGQACASPAECESNMCRDGICTRDCNEAAPCPDPFVCDSAGLCAAVSQEPAEPPDDEDAEEGCHLGRATSSGRAWYLLVALVGLRRRRWPVSWRSA
jgi:hypothetical protein